VVVLGQTEERGEGPAPDRSQGQHHTQRSKLRGEESCGLAEGGNHISRFRGAIESEARQIVRQVEMRKD